MPINATWHEAHPMPKRPTAAQRLAWHLEHAKECACRELSADMRKRLTQAARAEAKRAAERAVPKAKAATKPPRRASG